MEERVLVRIRQSIVTYFKDHQEHNSSVNELLMVIKFHAGKKTLAAVGFEPTPPKRLVP